jgi:hypothetical protein
MAEKYERIQVPYQTPQNGKIIAWATLWFSLAVMGFGVVWIVTGTYQFSTLFFLGLGSIVFLEAVLIALLQKSFTAVFEKGRVSIGKNIKSLITHDSTGLSDFKLIPHDLRDWELHHKRNNNGISGGWFFYSKAWYLVLENQKSHHLAHIATIWGEFHAIRVLTVMRALREEMLEEDDGFGDEDIYESRPKP